MPNTSSAEEFLIEGSHITRKESSLATTIRKRQELSFFFTDSATGFAAIAMEKSPPDAGSDSVLLFNTASYSGNYSNSSVPRTAVAAS